MKKVYFLGICGVSMSSLAIMMKEKGFEVCGSDEVENKSFFLLRERGIEVDFCTNEEKIKSADLVVCSSAIKKDNEQLCYAKKLDKKIVPRGWLLGKISDEYEKVIAISGSHGKTTTTALIYQILFCAGVEPILHLGGYRLEDGRNYVLSKQKEYFITEACEYCDNFLHLHPYISVITNIEKEHMDYFKTFERQLKSFDKFKSQSRYVIEGVGKLRAKNLRHDKFGNLSFNLFEGERKIFHVRMQICEEVNVFNCMYAYRVAKLLNISDKIIKIAFETFKGVETRFERKKCEYFDNVICDYAHHPTEIEKAIKSAKKIFKSKQILTIFQPHTFSRTMALFDDFLKVFKNCEYPIIFKTYSAREKEEEGMGGEEFAKNLKKINKNAKYFENFDDLFQFLIKFNKNDTVLLFVGAGDLPAILNKNNFIT